MHGPIWLFSVTHFSFKDATADVVIFSRCRLQENLKDPSTNSFSTPKPRKPMRKMMFTCVHTGWLTNHQSSARCKTHTDVLRPQFSTNERQRISDKKYARLLLQSAFYRLSVTRSQAHDCERCELGTRIESTNAREHFEYFCMYLFCHFQSHAFTPALSHSTHNSPTLTFSH